MRAHEQKKRNKIDVLLHIQCQLFSLGRTYLEWGIKVELSHLHCELLSCYPLGRCLSLFFLLLFIIFFQMSVFKVGILTLNFETVTVDSKKSKLTELNNPFTICFLE